MQYIALFLNILTYSSSRAQDFQYPVLPNTSNSITNFIPKNWTIIDKAYGDLNKDGLKDIAFELEYSNYVNETLPPDNKPRKSVPRILVIAFKNKAGGYSLAAKNNLFLRRAQEIDDMPGGTENAHLFIDMEGVLHLHYYLFRGDFEYKVRYQNNDFFLIGYKEHGSAGSFRFWDEYDFLSKVHYRKTTDEGQEGSTKRTRSQITNTTLVSDTKGNQLTILRPSSIPPRLTDIR